MTTQSFKVTYDGEALRSGAMTVRDLAGALLAVGKAIEEANRLFNGDRIAISVNVLAVKPGSCTIELLCNHSFFQSIKDFFAGEDITTVTALLSLLGFTVKDMGKGTIGSLIRLLKWARGRRLKKVAKIGDGQVTLTFDDERQIDVPAPVLQLYRDINIRRAITDMTKPLEQEGIDVILMGEEGVEPDAITKEHLVGFAAPEIDDEPITEDEHKKAFSIVSLAFKDDNKWRLFDGQNGINVAIADDDFLKRVDANEEAFSKGDILVCRVLTKQWRTSSGLKTEHTVLEVVEHQSAARQIPLPLGSP